MSRYFFLVVGIRQHVTFQELEPLRSKRTTYLIFHLKLFHDGCITIFNPSIEALYIFLADRERTYHFLSESGSFFSSAFGLLLATDSFFFCSFPLLLFSLLALYFFLDAFFFFQTH